jgi:hypothetical protein
LEPTDEDFEQMMRTLIGLWMTQITGPVVAYSLTDHLAKRSATAEQITALEGIDPITTFGLLRACASLGFVTFDGTVFKATPLLGTLQKDIPGSLRSLAMAFAARGHWRPWGKFLEAMRTCKPQTGPALGVDLWDYYEQTPEEGATFMRAMHSITSGIIRGSRSHSGYIGRKTGSRYWWRQRHTGSRPYRGKSAPARNGG